MPDVMDLPTPSSAAGGTAPAAGGTAPAESPMAAPAAPAGALVRGRDPHIDIMKGVGMLLVLMYHLQTEAYLGYSIIGFSAMFMMPLFFFVSGYLHAGSSDEKLPFGRYLVKKVLTILLPYAIFFVLSFFWMETIYSYAAGGTLFGFPFSPLQLVQAFFLAGNYLYDLAVVPFPLWFLHALFIASILFFFVAKIRSHILQFVLAVALTIAAVPLQAALADSPLWFVKLMPLALAYMLFGHLFRWLMSIPTTETPTPEKRDRSRLIMAFLALGCFLAGLYCMRYGGGDMWNIASYWHVPGVLVCILGVYFFSRTTTNRLLQFVGVYSILYLGPHPLIMRLPFVDGMLDWFERQGFDGVIVYAGYFVVTFLIVTVLVAIAMYIRRGVMGLVRARAAQRAWAKSPPRKQPASPEPAAKEAKTPYHKGQ